MLHWAPSPPVEGKWIGDRVVKYFSEAGIHLSTFAVDIGDYVEAHLYEGAMSDVSDRKRVIGVTSFPYRENYTYDFSKLDKQIADFLNSDPEAYTLLRVGLEEQVGADTYHFIDPSKSRKVIDYFEFSVGINRRQHYPLLQSN